MTVATTLWRRQESLEDQLLSYANTSGIHMFGQSPRSLTIVGNQDQGTFTLVLSHGGKITHRVMPKWLWQVGLVRWFYAYWMLRS